MLLSALTGVIGGISATLLLALINRSLTGAAPVTDVFILQFLSLLLATTLFGLTSQLVLIRLSAQFYYDLQLQLCQQILSTPLRQLEEIGTPRLLAVLSQDIITIAIALSGIPALSTNATILVSCLLYLSWLSPQTFLIFVEVTIPGMFVYWMLISRAKQAERLARQKWDEIFTHYRSLTDGTKELKLHRSRRWSFFSQMLQPTAESHLQHVILSASLYHAGEIWSRMLYLLFILVLFIFFTRDRTNLEILTSYTVVLLYLRVSLSSFLSIIPSISRANIALEKIAALNLSSSLLARGLDPTSLTPSPSARQASHAPWQSLTLVNALHSYTRECDGRGFTLGPISLTWQPGELVFIVGANGSGKTTLLKMLAGLYTPESGEIRLDGIPITDQNREDYRQLFSVLFSDGYPFDHLFGLDGPNLDRRAQEYLQQLQLDHKVLVEDGKLSTTELSFGQRKRLALLTAYLEDRPIYVFDEWAASQDLQFKDVFYCQCIKDLQARGKLVIVISHDDQYYHLADRVITLKDGQLE